MPYYGFTVETETGRQSEGSTEMGYVKYCERACYAADVVLDDAIFSGDPQAIARADFDLSMAYWHLNRAVAEEVAEIEAWALEEEMQRQEEAWNAYDYAVYAADIAECDPYGDLWDIGPGWRGCLAA
jgi:hypothetical protein